jgi:hypothetical protein
LPFFLFPCLVQSGWRRAKVRRSGFGLALKTWFFYQTVRDSGLHTAFLTGREWCNQEKYGEPGNYQFDASFQHKP